MLFRIVRRSVVDNNDLWILATFAVCLLALIWGVVFESAVGSVLFVLSMVWLVIVIRLGEKANH